MKHDDELIASVAELSRRHRPRILETLIAKVGDESEAERLTDLVFAKLHSSADKFVAGQSNVAVWTNWLTDQQIPA